MSTARSSIGGRYRKRSRSETNLDRPAIPRYSTFPRIRNPTADKKPVSSIGTSASSGHLQAILSALQSGGRNRIGSSGDTLPISQQGDDARLSPFAQLMSTLQQLQQSNPAKYGQVMRQIVTNSQKAAQTAQTDGNPAEADQLNQVAGIFADASQSGHLDIQGLAETLSGGHNVTPISAGHSNHTLNQLLSLIQGNLPQPDPSQTDSLNPMSIIVNTLSNAGVTSQQAN